MQNYFENIFDYLDGTLPPEDKQLFEAELQANEDLRNETARQRDLQAILRKQIAAEDKIIPLNTTLSKVGNTYFKKKDRVRILRWLLPVAVAACLLLVFRFWSDPGFEKLPDMPSATQRGDREEATYDQAVKTYNEGDYPASIRHLSVLAPAEEPPARYTYYLGLSYLGNKEYAADARELREVAEGKSVFAPDACYFLGVALWKTDQDTEAGTYLERVPRSSSYYEKAQKLNKQLRR